MADTFPEPYDNAGGDEVTTAPQKGDRSLLAAERGTQKTRRLETDADSNLYVNVAAGTITATIGEVEIKNDTGNPVPVSDAGSSLTVDGTMAVSNFPATQNVAITSSVEVEVKNDAGSPVPVSGTVTANAGTGPFPVSDNSGSLTVDGTIAATQSGSWVVSVDPDTQESVFIYRNLDVDEVGKNISGAPAKLYGWDIFNNAGTTRYIKLYDKTTAPSVGTDVPRLTIPVASMSSLSIRETVDITFSSGLGIGATTGLADSSMGAPAANDVVVNLYYTDSFDPTDISGLAGWFMADADTYQDSALTIPAVTDGDVVGGWKDRSGNLRHVLQTTAANKPLLKLNVVNGKPVLRFDNSNDFLQSATITTLAQPNTVFIVFNATQTANDNCIFDAVTQQTQMMDYTGVTSYRIIAGGTGLTGGTANTGVWHIRMGKFNGGSSLIRVDGVTVASGAEGTSGMDGFTVGSRGNGAPFFGGDIAEVIVYNASLSTDQMANVERYLSLKYDLRI